MKVYGYTGVKIPCDVTMSDVDIFGITQLMLVTKSKEGKGKIFFVIKGPIVTQKYIFSKMIPSMA